MFVLQIFLDVDFFIYCFVARRRRFFSIWMVLNRLATILCGIDAFSKIFSESPHLNVEKNTALPTVDSLITEERTESFVDRKKQHKIRLTTQDQIKKDPNDVI